eukprot:RCo028195
MGANAEEGFPRTPQEIAMHFYDPITLPIALQGYVKYVVALDPADNCPYSIGIRYVCRSKGTQDVLIRLTSNISRRHKKRVHGWLCPCVSQGRLCPLHWRCPGIHVTPSGYAQRRQWTQELGPSQGTWSAISEWCKQTQLAEAEFAMADPPDDGLAAGMEDFLASYSRMASAALTSNPELAAQELGTRGLSSGAGPGPAQGGGTPTEIRRTIGTPLSAKAVPFSPANRQPAPKPSPLPSSTASATTGEEAEKAGRLSVGSERSAQGVHTDQPLLLPMGLPNSGDSIGALALVPHPEESANPTPSAAPHTAPSEDSSGAHEGSAFLPLVAAPLDDSGTSTTAPTECPSSPTSGLTSSEGAVKARTLAGGAEGSCGARGSSPSPIVGMDVTNPTQGGASTDILENSKPLPVVSAGLSLDNGLALAHSTLQPEGSTGVVSFPPVTRPSPAKLLPPAVPAAAAATGVPSGLPFVPLPSAPLSELGLHPTTGGGIGVESDDRFYDIVTLPAALQSYVKYVVALDPADNCPYSIGIRHVCQSKGTQDVLIRLSRNISRTHKKPVHGWLCPCVSQGRLCPLQWRCPGIHVTPSGYAQRRQWTQDLGYDHRMPDAISEWCKQTQLAEAEFAMADPPDDGLAAGMEDFLASYSRMASAALTSNPELAAQELGTRGLSSGAG